MHGLRKCPCALQVRFEFPEPSELPSSSLLQLIDADFKYPGRDDFGLQAGHLHTCTCREQTAWSQTSMLPASASSHVARLLNAQAAS
jgi:hypothetical protein